MTTATFHFLLWALLILILTAMVVRAIYDVIAIVKAVKGIVASVRYLRSSRVNYPRATSARNW